MSGHTRWRTSGWTPEQRQEFLDRAAAWSKGCEGGSARGRTGWYAGRYHRRRWWWSPPWKVTRPWLPRVLLCRTGGDGWCNPTWSLVLPFFLGDLVVRYRRGSLRTLSCDDCIAESTYGFCRFCGTVDCLSLLPEEES